MTTPDQAQGNTDAPIASVPTFGLSEILSILGLLASLLTVFFGQDFGITKNAQAIAALAVVLLPMATSIARAIKHHGADHANARVYLAQLEAVSQALGNPAKNHSPQAVADGIAVLNTGASGDAAP